MSNEDIEEIRNDYNKNHAAVLLLFCRYFANARSPALPRMDALDANGLTVSYTESSLDGLSLKEVKITFSRGQTNATASLKDKILKGLKQLENEAKAVNDMLAKVDKSYIPPGRINEDDIKYFVPSVLGMSLTALWYAFIIQLYLSTENSGLFGSLRLAVGHVALNNISLAFICINSAMGLATLAFSVWASFPQKYIVGYPLLTLFGGFMIMGPVVKLAFKHHEIMERKSVIGTRNDVE